MSVSMSATFAPAAPPCPKCKTPLEGIGERGEGACSACATALEFVFYPARHRAKPVARAVRSVDGDATCFFHAQNQAVVVCADCGRYLCGVCEVGAEDGRKLCPPCVASGRKKTAAKADELITYDAMASTLAIFPLLIWPFTLATAPVALGLAIYGWKKPRSLVRSGTARLIVAIVLASLQICAWAGFFIMLWLE